MRVFVVYLQSGSCIKVVCDTDVDIDAYSLALAAKLDSSVSKVVEVS